MISPQVNCFTIYLGPSEVWCQCQTSGDQNKTRSTNPFPVIWNIFRTWLLLGQGWFRTQNVANRNWLELEECPGNSHFRLGEDQGWTVSCSRSLSKKAAKSSTDHLRKVQMACSIFAPGKWWKMRLFKFTFSRISAPNPQNQPLHINFIPFHLKSARPKLIRPQEPNSKSYIKFTTSWFEPPEKMLCLGLLCQPVYCADKETSVSDPFLAVHPMGYSTVKRFRAKQKRNFDQMKIPSWTQRDFTPNSPTARFCCMSWLLKS